MAQMSSDPDTPQGTPATGEDIAIPARRLLSTRPRILVVEDDFEMRRLLAHRLKAEGYEVVEAANGYEAIEQLGGNRSFPHDGPMPDLTVMDIRIPWFDGLKILEGVRRYSPGLPVILITAFGDPATVAQGLRLGAIEVLDKPFELETLSLLVRRALKGGRQG